MSVEYNHPINIINIVDELEEEAQVYNEEKIFSFYTDASRKPLITKRINYILKKKNETESFEGYYSLFLFSETNIFRKFLRKILLSKPFKLLIFTAVIVSTVIYILQPSSANTLGSKISTYSYIELGIACLFSSELIFELIVKGFVLHRGSYLRDYTNWFDLLVTIVSILSLDFFNLGINTTVLNSLKPLRTLRLVELFLLPASMKIVSTTLTKIPIYFCTILFFIVLIGLIFAILILNQFFSLLLTVCVNLITNEIVDSVYLTPQVCGFNVSSYNCQSGYICSPSNKWNGIFETGIFINDLSQSLFVTTLVLTSDGLVELLTIFSNAVDFSLFYVWIYIIPLNYIGTYILLNSLSGIICGLYTETRKIMMDRKNIRSKFSTLSIQKQLPMYVNWVKQGKACVLNTIELTLDKVKNIKNNTTNFCIQTNKESEKYTTPLVNLILSKETGLINIFHNIHSNVKDLVKSIWFELIDSFFITICIVSSASTFNNEPSWLVITQFYIDIIVRCIFVLFLIMRLLCEEIKIFYKNIPYMLDIIFTLCGVIDVVFIFVFGYHFSLATLRIYFILSFLSKSRFQTFYNGFINPLTKSFGPIFGLMLVDTVLIAVFGMISMGIFGPYSETINAAYSATFDTFLDSLLTSFQVFIGTDWYNITADAIKIYGVPAIGYIFFLFLLIGKYTFIALHLAILSDNIIVEKKINMSESKDVKEGISWKNNSQIPKYMGTLQSDSNEITTGFKFHSIITYIENIITIPGLSRDPLIKTSTLFIFSYTNRFRIFLFHVLQSIYYDFFIAIIIIASLVLICADDPTDFQGFTLDYSKIIDYALNSIFLLEMIIKIIVSGLILHKGSYLRNIWNISDALTIIISGIYIYLSIYYSDFIYFRLIKMFRIIRILRCFKLAWRFSYFKDIAVCVSGAIKGVVLAYFLLFLTLTTFSCIGMKIYQGNLNYCIYKSNNIGLCNYFYDVPFNSTDSTAISIPIPSWYNYQYNFENFYYSIKTLFVAFTNELWQNLMYYSIEKIIITNEVTRRNSYVTVIFFMLFQLICSFYLHKLLCAYLLVNIRNTQILDDRGLTINQRDCLELALSVYMKRLYSPRDRKSIHYKIWRIVDSSAFEIFVIVLIYLNTVLYGLAWPGISINLITYILYAKIAFTGLFCIELLLKLYAYRMYFFQSWFNIFDIILLILRIVFLVILFMNPSSIPSDFGCFIVFRCLKIIFLFQKHKTFFTITELIKETIQYLPYIFVLLFCILFTYGIIGMELFSTIVPNDYQPISRNFNFKNFLYSLLQLHRILTGDDWFTSMEECANSPECNPESKLGCSFTFSYVYFISFVLLMNTFLSNIFISIIVRSFEHLTHDRSMITKYTINEFIEILTKFDPSGSGMILHTDLLQALRRMEPPFGVGKYCPLDIAYRRMTQINIPIYRNNLVSFHEAIFALVRTSLKLRVNDNNSVSNDRDIIELIKHTWPWFRTSIIDRTLLLWLNIDSETITLPKVYTAKLLFLKYLKLKGIPEQINREIKLIPPENEQEGNIKKDVEESQENQQTQESNKSGITENINLSSEQDTNIE